MYPAIVMIRQKTKDFIGNYFSKFNYPIIVNSFGRSGSTVLVESIRRSAINFQNRTIYKIAFRSISQSAWCLEGVKLKDGIVYKTHDYPPRHNLREGVRMVYVFADPVDVVFSLLRVFNDRGEEWMREHCSHLKVPFNNFRNIIYEDQLRLENHLDCWLQEKRFPIAFVKYELMWDHQKDISDFLGLNIQLPPFRKRKAKEQRNKDLVKKVKKTYESLIEKVNNLDEFFIHNLER